MNNEIQLANLGQSLPMQAGAGGALPGAYTGGTGGGGGGEENPLLKVHKLLRGRYLLACVLGLLGATAGAVAGYLSQKPAFKATALIEFKPVNISREFGKDKLMVMFSAYVYSQQKSLESGNLVEQAIKDPRVKAARAGMAPLSISEFSTNLVVSPAPKTNTMIEVGYTCKGKQAEAEAAAAVQALVKAWKENFDTDDVNKSVEKRLDFANNQINEIKQKIQSKESEIDVIQNTSPGQPQLIARYEEDLKKIQDEKAETLKTLRAVEQILKNNSEAKLTDWKDFDPALAKNIATREDLELQIQIALSQGIGPMHQSLVRTRDSIKAIQARIDEQIKLLSSQYVIITKPDGKKDKVSKSLDEYNQRIAACDEQTKTLKDVVVKTRAANTAINKLNLDIIELRGKIAKAEDDKLDADFQIQTQMKYVIKDDGKNARPDKDSRLLFSAAGFMGGAGIPIGLLMLFGLFDTRYRYSDETGAGASGIGGLTLLGILPNLPDRLSDPEQAAIAAHCVHQIRTMLQINANLEDRHVFAVTSASPGDGKTSLTLALGLSYAACGTRTLLIDCDLIGSGLSNRMNVSAPEGVLEAIANQSLMSYVRQTDVNDVSILPVGSSGNLHASTLSPQSLRRLISEAEQHFEVVLIDTGPILGSIEASLVCAAADAVILTVSRGQQRPMVERSLGHLGAIGARLAGVVFNRAQSQDFEKSISGVAMRSVGVPGLPRGARPTGTRLGPVVRAVQGSDTVDQDNYGQPPTQ